MNLFCDLYPQHHKTGIENLIEKLGVSKLFFTYIDPEDSTTRFSVPSEGLCMHDSFIEELAFREMVIPLDKDIISAMEKYESTLKDLIYRWRTTLLDNFSHPSIRKKYFDLLRYWNHFLESNSITLCYFSEIPHSVHAFTLYALCKAKGIPVILSRMMPYISGAEICSYFSTGIESLYPSFMEEYAEIKIIHADFSNEMPKIPAYLDVYFREYRDKGSNSMTYSDNTNDSILKIMSVARKRVFIYFRKKEVKRIMRKGMGLLGRWISQARLLRYVEHIEIKPDVNSNYVFFPLHLQPEASTCPTSGIFAHQEIAIDLVSKSLPKGWILYVKEHPAYWAYRTSTRFDDMRDYRSREYYDRILALDNVYIIDHQSSTAELLKNCKAMASINGSAAWESLFFGVPVLMFGNAFYSYSENVYKASCQKDCEKFFRKIESGNINRANEKSIRLFLMAMDKVIVNAYQDYGFMTRVNGTKQTKEENSTVLTNGIIDFYSKVYSGVTNENGKF